MKKKIKDLTIEEFIKLMLNPKTRELVDGPYDLTYVQDYGDGRICIDGIIDIEKIIEIN